MLQGWSVEQPRKGPPGVSSSGWRATPLACPEVYHTVMNVKECFRIYGPNISKDRITHAWALEKSQHTKFAKFAVPRPRFRLRLIAHLLLADPQQGQAWGPCFPGNPFVAISCWPLDQLLP